MANRDDHQVAFAPSYHQLCKAACIQHASDVSHGQETPYKYGNIPVLPFFNKFAHKTRYPKSQQCHSLHPSLSVLTPPETLFCSISGDASYCSRAEISEQTSSGCTTSIVVTAFTADDTTSQQLPSQMSQRTFAWVCHQGKIALPFMLGAEKTYIHTILKSITKDIE